jgi:hypothetical protein
MWSFSNFFHCRNTWGLKIVFAEHQKIKLINIYAKDKIVSVKKIL